MAIFWCFGSAVSLQQQSAGDHVLTAAISGSKRARRPMKCLQAHEKLSGDCSGCQRERIILHCFRLRHRAQIDFGKFRQGEHLRVPRRKHHHRRRRTFPFRGGVVPAEFHWQRRQQNPRHFFPESFCTVASPYSKGVVSIRRRSAT